MKKQTIFALYCLCLSSCSPREVTIDFHVDRRAYMMIPVTIRDTTIHFIFDTGASGSAIDCVHINRVSINRNDSAWVIAPAMDVGKKMYHKTFPEKVNIGGLNVPRNISFITGKVVTLKEVAGMDIIDQLCWRFNFKTKKVTIAKHSLKIDDLSDWVKIPYVVENGAFLIPISLNDRVDIGKILFDTGAYIRVRNGGSLIIGSKQPCDSAILNQFAEKFYASGFSKLMFETGKENSWMLWCDSIRLFNHLSRNCWVNIKCNDNYPENLYTVLTLGYVTEQFTEMYIDSRKKIMYLK